MNYSQCFEEPGSRVPDHVNLAMLAQQKLAVVKGEASA